MKKTRFIIFVIITAIFGIILLGCAENNSDEGQLMRLHIRADSNEKADQDVKLLVRDEIVEYLEDELKDANDFNSAKAAISKRLDELKKIADKILKNNGFSYKATVSINNEYFPTRMYGDLVIESGWYDALIISLGSGEGDNWWCVVYPPLCYVEAVYGSGFKYKSKLQELIDKYFG